MPVKLNKLKKADAVFALTILMFLLLVFLINKSFSEVTESRKVEERTYTILHTLERLLTNTVDIETGSRGYAITGNEIFLKPFERSKVSVKLTIDSLQTLIVDDEQRVRLDTLTLLLKQKLAINESIVLLRKQQGMDEAVDYIAQGEGQRVMDSIRNVIGRAVTKELNLLADRSTTTNEQRAARARYFILLIILSISLIVMAYLIIRKNMRKLMENKELQEILIEELTYQNKQLDDFAHITSHNIRGPVNNINALVMMVNTNSQLSDYQRIFSKIEKVAQNINDTLNGLLDMLWVKKIKSVEKTTLSFLPILLKETENLEEKILACKAEIEHDFSAAETIVYPKVYLESIVHNLISNALKYRAPDRTPMIRVTTEQKDGHVLLHVRDNGLGIDLERFGAEIFGLRKTFHNHPEATGVGLFMTKNQVEALGGEITVESIVGTGTTFTVRF